jgi:hypothetical protein
MATLLALHVLISLIAIALGMVTAAGLIGRPPRHRASVAFLWTTILTSVSGFPLPADRILPSHIVGAISLVLLALAAVAWHRHRLAGGWARVWVVTALAAFYLNVFVLVVQAFLRVPGLHAVAPTQAEPPFAIAQGAVLLFFAVLTVTALRRGPAALTSPSA